MRWKILSLFLALMSFALGFWLLFLVVQPKDFIIPFEVPRSSNFNVNQRFIQGSLPLSGDEDRVGKESLCSVNFERCFVSYLNSREKIYITWQVLDTENDKVFVSTENLPIDGLKLFNSIESIELLFDRNQILVKTKPFWFLTIAAFLSLFFALILAVNFIWRFKGR
jgi:hypothetical protein